MTQEIRYGEFVREVTINQQNVSYNLITPPFSMTKRERSYRTSLSVCGSVPSMFTGS
jgi:hypothetical protein